VKQLLVVAHTPSPNTEALAQATLSGCRHQDFESVESIHIPPLEATADDVLKADAPPCGIEHIQPLLSLILANNV